MAFEMKCVFCSAPWTRDMVEAYNGTYGCDSGCDYVRIKVECSSCHRVIYEKGKFGEFRNQAEKIELEDEFVDEIAAGRAEPYKDN